MTMTAPLNLAKWIEEHRHLLRPPVGNKVIWEDGAFIAMVVGGPNARTDFHIDSEPEFFYQIEGDIVLKVVEDDEHRDVLIKEGDIFLLPPNVPHSPRRPRDTVGLVIEARRPPDALDGFVWYCERCGETLHEVTLHVADIEKQLTQVIQDHERSETARTCDNCGMVN